MVTAEELWVPVGSERRRLSTRPAAGGSFESFYDEHWSAVVAVTAALCRDVAVAEELAQEAFLRAYRRWSRVASLERGDLWVRRVALNLAVSRFRRVQAETRALARTVAGRRAAERALSDEVEEFWEALRNLPRRQGQAAALFYVDDLSVADVAELLGCAEGTVKAHLHAARQQLRSSLADLGKERT